jgi:hypothetical protein|tara:strand:+ start:302 stop:514 length:213 start_codon:yes stop_codon:yes gene_type:complete
LAVYNGDKKMKYKLIMYLTSNHYGNTSKTEINLEEGESIDRLIKHFTKIGKEGHTLQHLTMHEAWEDDDD